MARPLDTNADRLQYAAPALRTYGDLGQLTRAVKGTSINPDGGNGSRSKTI